MTPPDLSPEKEAPRNAQNYRTVLEAQRLVKRFGHIVALDEADLELRAGEVLAVIGDNGAGKSTLAKALSGAMRPDAGQILLNGQPVHWRAPLDARRAGIETIYQDLAVIPSMTIVENLFLGQEMRRPGLAGRVGLIDRRRMLEECVARVQELNIGIQSLNQKVESLSGGQRQCVAVARAAAFARHVVIMDEPTASLGVMESNKVLELIRSIRDRGLSVLLISHNVPQVFEVADRIHIARRGRRVAVLDPRVVSMSEAVAMMTGTIAVGP